MSLETVRIDTALLGSGDAEEDQQAVFLERSLEERSERPVMLFQHLPPYENDPDDTAFTTAVSIVNPNLQGTSIAVTVRDVSGQTIGTSSISLAAKNKASLFLKNLPGLRGIVGSRGSVDFGVTTGSVAVLGLRFNGVAFTSIPATEK